MVKTSTQKLYLLCTALREKRGWKLSVLLLLLLCITCLCGACGKKEPAVSEEQEKGFCKDISIFDCLGTQSFCDKGMLKVTREGIIVFYEYGTGYSYPLCSNAYCEHEPYDPVKNPDPVCEATLAGLKFACIYGDNLYVVQETGWKVLQVQVRNLRESGYRVVAELPYCNTFSTMAFNAIRGDKAYLFLGVVENDREADGSSYYTPSDLYNSLVELDLKTGKYKTLFCIEEGGRKYKVLRTVYTKEGIYMQWYYEDTFYDQETGTGGANAYWDKFFYVSYDGTVRKELCKEVTELTAFDKESGKMVMIEGIGEQGVYYPLQEENTLKCYYYEKEAQIVYKQPEEKERMLSAGESGNYFLISVSRPDGSCLVTGTDLTTKEERKREMEETFRFMPLRDGVFIHSVHKDDGDYRQFWNYADIFSEDGAPFFTYKE